MPPLVRRSPTPWLSLTLTLFVVVLGVGAALTLACPGSAFAQQQPSSAPATAHAPLSPPAALARDAGPCDDLAIAQAFRDLFPPAPPSIRARSAERLAACNTLGADGAMAAALPQSSDDDDGVAIASALFRFRTVVARDALRETVQRFASRPRVREVAMQALASVGLTDDVVAVVNNLRESDAARAAALGALGTAGRVPAASYLTWVAEHSGPKLHKVAARLLDATARDSTAVAATTATRPTTAPGAAKNSDETAPSLLSSTPSPSLPPPPALPAAPSAPAAPAGPIDGRPLTIGASTVAGAALFLNLSRLGIQDVTPQLLLGSAGAVIGFGTSWALSRFGVRPTVEQAAWFANVTAWGTLAGLTISTGSGIDNYKLRYGSLIAGEMVGMAAGVWSAHRWTWTPSQVALSDSLLLGLAMTAAGARRINGDDLAITPEMAIAVVPAMIAAAIAGHALSPTTNDLVLMTGLGVSGAYLGSLIASGAADTSWLGSHAGQGGLLAGAGLGYLAGAAAGAFTEVAPARVAMGGYAMLAGNALGLGAHMFITGQQRRAGGALAPGDGDRWKLGAGLGGAALGALGFALQPQLHLGPSATELQLWGVTYGAGVYALASWASARGTPVTDADRATFRGGALALGVTGGLTGLWLSQRFAPDARDQLTTFGMTAGALSAGWGTALLLTDKTGAADGIGIAAGAAAGLSAAALFTHSMHLSAPALGAAVLGSAYGGLLGIVLPSSTKLAWQSNRATGGGALLGFGAGALGGAAVAQATGASADQVAAASTAATLGLGVGLGGGLMLRSDSQVEDSDTRAPRIGAVAGTTAFLGGAVLLGGALHLTDPRPPASTAALTTTTTALGLADGLWLAALLDPAGTASGARADRLRGGLLFGGALGLTTGLVLAPRMQPDAPQLLLLTATTALGTGMGRGIALLASDTPGRADSAATLAGALVGTAGGTWAAIKLRRRLDPASAPGDDAPSDLAPVLGATTTGLAYGAFLGALAPQLSLPQWTAGRATEGGTWVGLGVGAIGAASLAELTHPSGREVMDTAVAGVLGAGIGLGAGTLATDGESQGMRIGTAVGTATLLGASTFLGRPLHLEAPMPEGSARLVLTSTTLGLFDGYWLAALVDPTGLPTRSSGPRLRGGLLLGGALGLGTGLVLAQHIDPESNQPLLIATATVAGSVMGRGISLLATSQPGRADSVAVLAGSLLGTAGGAVAAAHANLADFDATDVGALSVGAGTGALLGALGPSLLELDWPGLRRDTSGGLWLGAGAGAVLGDTARRAFAGTSREVALTGVAALDGMTTGVGFGLLLRTRHGVNDAAPATGGDSSSDRPIRIGMFAGTAIGLGMGLESWSRQTMGPGDLPLVTASVAFAGWNGALIPRLGHASSADVDTQRVVGGILAGAGTASFVTAALTPHLAVDVDLVENAVAMDAVFSGLGAGVGQLASARDDAPVWGLLGGGVLGLGLGGVLHDRLELRGEAMPVLTFGTVEGVWTGAFLPYLFHPRNEVSARERAGGLLAGTFGGLGLALLASTVTEPSAEATGLAGVGSGIGASIAGGVALLSSQIRDEPAAALTLAGSTLGAGAGGLLSSRLRFDASDVGYATVGGVLGTGEALTFAWSGRASGQDQFLGAGLLGAGVGASLGLAATATMNDARTQTPVLAGFAAWGAWIGGFSGSLFARDPHEITAGALLGSNLGFLAGYGLLETERVEPGDFGWLSLSAALGTALGAGVGAPFASRGEPRPILGGLAIGSAVGMTVGAVVVSRFRHVTPHPKTPVARATGVDSPPALRTDTGYAAPEGDGKSEASVSSTAAAQNISSSAATTRAIDEDVDPVEAERGGVLRAIHASIRIEDCAPLIGALPPSPDSPPASSPPILIGLTGRWH